MPGAFYRHDKDVQPCTVQQFLFDCRFGSRVQASTVFSPVGHQPAVAPRTVEPSEQSGGVMPPSRTCWTLPSSARQNVKQSSLLPDDEQRDSALTFAVRQASRPHKREIGGASGDRNMSGDCSFFVLSACALPKKLENLHGLSSTNRAARCRFAIEMRLVFPT